MTAPRKTKQGRLQSSSRNGLHKHRASCSKNSKSCCRPVTNDELSTLATEILSPPSRYRIKDLAYLLRHWQHNTYHANGKSEIIKLFSSLPTRTKSFKKAGRSKKVMEDLVLKCFPLLDDMHFWGLLQKSQLKVRFADDFEGNKSLGYQNLRENSAKGIRQYITLYRIPDIPPFHDLYFRNYLGVLVHEMIHAFFALYQCRDTQKCINANAIQEGEFGDSPGHGPAFERTEHWLADVNFWRLEIDLRIDYRENVRVIPDRNSEPEDELDCCWMINDRYDWKKELEFEDESYEIKWEKWLGMLDLEKKVYGRIPTYPEELSDGLSYEFVTGEGYVLDPPSASRQEKSETRGDIMLDMSFRKRSKYRDKLRKERKKHGDNNPRPKVSKRNPPSGDESEKETEGGGRKPNKAVKRRKGRAGEISRLIDEGYGLQEYDDDEIYNEESHGEGSYDWEN